MTKTKLLKAKKRWADYKKRKNINKYYSKNIVTYQKPVLRQQFDKQLDKIVLVKIAEKTVIKKEKNPKKDEFHRIIEKIMFPKPKKYINKKLTIKK